MNLILETTTGQLLPPGSLPTIAHGGGPATLRFVTNGVAVLLPEAAPIALKIYDADSQELASFVGWTADPAAVLYRATLNVLASALAWRRDPALFCRVVYGDPETQSAQFHAAFSTSATAGVASPPIIITQPTGPVNYAQYIGTFAGRVAVNQVEGFWRVKTPGLLNGLQLAAQVAPDGADLLVEVVKNGVPTGAIATLTAGQKVEETTFGLALNLQIGDIIQFRATQVGSSKPGGNLNVNGDLQLL